jgi:hypothetical protein
MELGLTTMASTSRACCCMDAGAAAIFFFSEPQPDKTVTIASAEKRFLMNVKILLIN